MDKIEKFKNDVRKILNHDILWFDFNNGMIIIDIDGNNINLWELQKLRAYLGIDPEKINVSSFGYTSSCGEDIHVLEISIKIY